MEKRLIVITGATGGIAQELVKLIPESDQLILMGRSQERLLEAFGSKANQHLMALDITDDAAVQEAVESIYQQFGQIDIFINNAGFGEFKAYDQYDSETIRQMFDVNTIAMINFSRLVGQKMAERGQGQLINIVSIAGLVASAKSTIYSASKFAMIGFSNALRLELADAGVYVTTVNPGPIATKFFDKADPSGDYLKSVQQYTLQADVVAKRIYKIFGKNKRELNMPFSLAATAKLYSLFPKTGDYLARKVFNYK
ncbi:SDR family NAD(P)-dependent oxidoreductase [Streptococcus loxodontisalivarius]|uniref:Short-subunit dehydrogenase n=1 Tax=Streptococcus loxodontisalivarius TaxID=1349415 RepID=A0ABS2PRI1_9STRE|nr:SDR family oxidoreductase [Streptococcus loxodontisalivarius]MBM7642643.1 short-subunit dehydrogenase [Streptococcus loxodontisalivarius]